MYVRLIISANKVVVVVVVVVVLSIYGYSSATVVIFSFIFDFLIASESFVGKIFKSTLFFFFIRTSNFSFEAERS